jgi:small subunit ribosomal protein S16
VAVKLRLVRMGKKKQPTYRVVAADSRSPRDGRFLEIVGTYAPRGRSTAEPEAVVTIDNAKALKWLQHGAKPTERVERLLRASGAWDEFTTGVPAPAPAAAGPAAGAAVGAEPAAGAVGAEPAGPVEQATAGGEPEPVAVAAQADGAPAGAPAGGADDGEAG